MNIVAIIVTCTCGIYDTKSATRVCVDTDEMRVEGRLAANGEEGSGTNAGGGAGKCTRTLQY